MARFSDIGIEQRKQTSLKTKATHYRKMAAAIACDDEATIATFPRYIPRGHTPDWYLTRAAAYEQQSRTAGGMAALLSDMQRRNQLEAMRADEVAAVLFGGRWPGDHGLLHTLTFWVDHIGGDLPYTWEKLTPEQRQMCQQIVGGCMAALIAAFDGQGPWTK